MEKADLAQKVVEMAKTRGADMSEAYLLDSESLVIEVRGQKVEAMKSAKDRGIGLRVIRDGRLGFAYSSDMDDKSLRMIVDQAIQNSEYTAKDKYNVLPVPQKILHKLSIYDPTIRQVPVEEKIAFLKEVEQVALGYDPRIKKAEKVAYQDANYTVAIFNSRGVNAEYQGSYCGSFATMVAEDKGDAEVGTGMGFYLRYDNLNAKDIGEEAALKAVRLLGAGSISSQKASIVLEPSIAVDFLDLLASTLAADTVQKGKSFFKGKVGRKIAADELTIIDDGTMEGGIASKPVDGEGVPTGRTVLVKEGELTGFLHNSYTAAKEGVSSTGNGIRGSYAGTPEIGTTNFYIQPGKWSQDDLIRDIKTGLFVTEIMGMHTANPISGDFSLGASGIWIENGKMIKPVRGVAIAGNMLDLLAAIDAVGSDLRFFGGTGSPTLRIQGISVSGS